MDFLKKGNSFMKFNKFEKAKEMFEKSLNVNPNNIETLKQLGNMFQFSNKLQKSVF